MISKIVMQVRSSVHSFPYVHPPLHRAASTEVRVASVMQPCICQGMYSLNITPEDAARVLTAGGVVMRSSKTNNLSRKSA